MQKANLYQCVDMSDRPFLCINYFPVAGQASPWNTFLQELLEQGRSEWTRVGWSQEPTEVSGLKPIVDFDGDIWDMEDRCPNPPLWTSQSMAELIQSAFNDHTIHQGNLINLFPMATFNTDTPEKTA